MSVVLRPLRFTADVPALRTLLETLGLRSRIESERGGWVDMVAGRGMVALHDSAASDTGGQPGRTRLSFEADDLDELAVRLRDAGYDDATSWDEAYGRVLSVTAPGGTRIWVDERSNDLYGYKLHEARPDERWWVTPVLRVADQAPWRHFLAVFGDELVDYGPPSDHPAAELAFRTSEPLSEVGRRLTAAGWNPARDRDTLTVLDPDGRTVTVTARAPEGSELDRGRTASVTG